MKFRKKHYRSQMDQKDCGVASLAMVFGYFGSYYSLARLRELAKTTILAGVINAISNLVLVFVVGGYAAPLSSIIAYSTIFICRYKDINKTKKIPLQKKVIFFSIFIIGISTLLYLQKAYIISMTWLVLIVGMYIAINRDKITQLLLLIKEKKRNEDNSSSEL